MHSQVPWSFHYLRTTGIGQVHFFELNFSFSLADDQDLKDLLIGESDMKNHNEDDETVYLETLGTNY